MNFQGKVALLTGGSSGMGQAGAIAFAQAGASVVIAARRLEAGSETVRLIQAAGGEARFIQTDVSSSETIAALY